MGKSWLLAVFVLGTFVSVNSLQCYQCNDCPSVLNETYLVTCGETVDPDPPNNGTNPDVPNNGTNTNPDVPINGTDTNPNVPNNGTNTNPNVPNNVTDTNPDVPINGTNTNPDNSNTEAAKQVLRVRRSIELDIDANKACLCYGMQCSCDKEGAIPRAVLYENTTWVCGSATYRRNGTEYKYKRCVADKVQNQEFCTWLQNATEVLAPILAGNDTDIQLTKCQTCVTDKCNGDDDDDNGASSVHSSILVAMVTLVTVFSVSN